MDIDVPLARLRRLQNGDMEQCWRLKETYEMEWRPVPEPEITPKEANIQLTSASPM